MVDDETRGFVVFNGNRVWCRPGFAHCLVVYQSGYTLLRADGFGNIPRIDAVGRSGRGDLVNLAIQYSGEGVVVPFTIRDSAPIRAPLIQSSCVGMVKALIGIRKPFIFTPHQLYRYLTGPAKLEVYKPPS